jgi:aspartate carbamoyltransferase catalytic subunit
VKSVEEVIKETDILYVTRIQKERFADEESYLALKGSYVISPDTLRNAKKKMAVMHPLPRVDELSPAIDSDPRAAYFRTVGNGLHLRMALLAAVMGKGV